MKREQVLWAPEDLEEIDLLKDIGFPGEFPYTRGIHPNMYRGRLWTMRQFAGFGLPDDTNKRFRKLWDEGETGFSTAFDLATLLGYDSDDPHSLGEVGKGGVAVDSMEDMMRLFRGIPIGRRDVSVSMTINAPACVLLAMYVVLAGKKRAKLENLRGTIQNDMLKEFTSQNETIVPHNASMKIFVDTVEFCTKYMPQYNPISISGYHMREAGATAVQELAFTLADGIAYVEACIERGLGQVRHFRAMGMTVENGEETNEDSQYQKRFLVDGDSNAQGQDGGGYAELDVRQPHLPHPKYSAAQHGAQKN